MAKEKLLTPKDLADYFGVPLGTVYRWNSDGTGPPYCKVGRHVRYSVDDVEAWRAGNRVTPRSSAA